MEIRPITFKATYEYRKNGCYFVKEEVMNYENGYNR